jgi:parallel beta-helix repeat protein
MRDLTCLSALLAASAQADTYYVAPPPAGSNANPGTIAQPWATLQHAADTVQPGDTVLVRGGDYAGAEFTTSGTALAPIVLAAYPGETPRVVSDISVQRPHGINLEGASYMTVDGFRVDNRTRAGIRAVLCEHVTIRNNRLDMNGYWGILTGSCDDLLIENNVASNSAVEHGIYVSNSGDRPTIRGNTIFGNRANGIHMNGDVSIQPGDGIISDAVVERNVIYENGAGGGSGINMDGVQDSVVRNNLLYDNHASGISLYQIDGGGPSTGNRVLNNTVIVAANGRWALNIQDGATGNTVRNNILYNLHSFRGSIDICSACLTGFTSDRNVVMDRFTTNGGSTIINLAQWQDATGQDSNSIVAVPSALFMDAAGDDYRLNATSPALDVGETRADVPIDLVGTQRPQGPGFDVGAYERPVGDLIFMDGFE